MKLRNTAASVLPIRGRRFSFLHLMRDSEQSLGQEADIPPRDSPFSRIAMRLRGRSRLIGVSGLRSVSVVAGSAADPCNGSRCAKVRDAIKFESLGELFLRLSFSVGFSLFFLGRSTLIHARRSGRMKLAREPRSPIYNLIGETTFGRLIHRPAAKHVSRRKSPL